MKQDVFSSCHPVVNFLYFVLVIGCSMFVMHPFFLVFSCLGGMAYYCYLAPKKALHTAGWLLLPVFFLTALINPNFTHEGVTLLCYLPNGNPLTLESIVYGLGAGAMLVCVLVWFSCYQLVMTSDKFVYLFGRAIPALSLVLSMVFRFVPRFQVQIEKVSAAQKCIGRDVSNGKLICRCKHGIKIMSIMITWALENSIETADSMRSRGYGLRGRTNFSIYRFDSRDKLLCCLLTGAGIIVLGGILTKSIRFLYYPKITMNAATPLAIIVYLCYGIL